MGRLYQNSAKVVLDLSHSGTIDQIDPQPLKLV
jgi:hypothetical protein